MSEHIVKWFKAAGVRALKTLAQTMVGGITVGVAMSEVDWIRVTSVAAVAAIMSLLTSVAGLPELEDEAE